MDLQLVGLPVADQIEVVGGCNREGEPARWYIEAGVVVVVEAVARAIAGGSGSRCENILFDVGESVAVHPRRHHKEALTGSVESFLVVTSREDSNGFTHIEQN